MRTEDMYPSTYDCAKIAGAGEDLTLRCLENARERVKAHHSRLSYAQVKVNPNVGQTVVAVCAVGAVLAEDGFLQGLEADQQGKKQIPPQNGARMMRLIEDQMSQEAREAITLLNAAALELHPEAGKAETHWSGPLEWVNQEWRSEEEMEGTLTRVGLQRAVKKEILRIYDHAIEQRKALALATS